MKTLAALAALAAFAQSAVAGTTLGLNFCDGWAAPHVSAGTADGFAGWTDSRAVGDTTPAEVQATPLQLGASGVSVTWTAMNTWSSGSESSNEQALYRVYLDDSETSSGVGVRVTINGLAGWLTATGTTGYRLRCYCNNDAANTYQPISVRNGSTTTSALLQTITSVAKGNGDYPTGGTAGNGESRGYGDSPGDLTADTITLTLPPRSGSIRGTLCGFKLTASGVPPVPPVVATLAATGVTDASAILNGTANANGLSTAVSFQYGLTTGYGSTLAAVPPTLTGSYATAVVATLTNLSGATTYHYRVAATSSAGTSYGPDQTFATANAVFLAELSVGTATLSPAFAKTVTNYAVQVPFATTSIRVTPAAEDAGATIRVQGVAVASSTASDPIALVPGNTIITTTVTAAAGSVTKNYVLTVTRLPLSYAFSSAASVPVTAGAFEASGETASLALNFAPPAGTDLTIVNNTGLAFIKGEFANLAQGQKVNLTYSGITYPFVANYYGGSGNDLVLQWAYTRIYGWGDNLYGAYGSTASTVPLAVGPSGAIAGKTVTAMAVGSGFTLALCADGTLAATGYNDGGALGIGDTIYHQVLPVAINGNGVLLGKQVVAIAAGCNHSVALCADGTLAAWGLNLYGEVGDGSTVGTRKYPVAVNATGVLAGRMVVAIAAGDDHTLALCADGSLVTWGANASGGLGNGTTTDSNVPVAVIATGALSGKTISAIAAGGSRCDVLCSDGTVVEWGSGIPLPVAVNRTGVLSGRTVTSIATTWHVSLALCEDGTVVAWGDNGMGGLGDGTYTAKSGPVAVTATGVLSGKAPMLVAGSFPSYVLCSDGTLAAWGDNQWYQFGDGTRTTSNVPMATTLSTLGSGEKFTGLAIGAGATHTMALAPVPLSANSNLVGLALGSAVLDPVFAPGVTAYTARVKHGTPTLTVTPTAADTMAKVTVNGVAVASGAACEGIAATPGSTITVKVTAENGSFTSYGLIVREDASLASLGLSQCALLPGFSPFVRNYSVSVGVATTSLVVTSVAADPTAAVTVNGTPASVAGVTVPLVYGANPVAVVVIALDGTVATYQVTVTRATSVDFTYTSASAVALTASTYVATDNSVNVTLGYAPATGTCLTVVANTGNDPIKGRFSNLTQGQLVTLVYNKVSYKFVANYYGGSGNDLVLQWAATKLYAWGYNYLGQIGTGTITNATAPTAVTATGVLAGKTITVIAEGKSHGLALCSDGSLAAWGSNLNGQLGNGSTTDSRVPVAVTTTGLLAGKTVIAIAAGSSHCLALCSDGTLAAWGANSNGQLGNGTVYDSNVPVAVITTGPLAGKTLTGMAGGDAYSLILCADGTVAGWGSNSYGQLGDGTTMSAIAPVAVVTSGVLAGKIVTAISAGSSHSLARCSDGTVAAWGDNSAGQLGNNSSVNSSVPVAPITSGILAGKTVIAVAAGAGYSHSLALCSDSTIAAWGDNSYSSLGTISVSSSKVPVAVDRSGILAGKTVTGIAAAYIHSLAFCADGTLAAWGHNGVGELGNGATTSSGVPVAVTTSTLGSGEKFMAMTTGCNAQHSMAVAAVPISTTPSLAGLTLNPGRLDMEFAPGTTTYTVRVPHGTPSVSVTPTASNRYATLTVNDVALASGSTSPAIYLSPGNMTIAIKITAQDGVSTATYTLTIKDDSTLSGLALGAGSLVPAFSSVTTAYTSYLPTATTSVTVTPTATDASASVTVNGTPVVPGNASSPVSLVAGSNTISVRVTALDGTFTIYPLTVIRQVPVNVTFSTATGIAVTAANYTAAGNTANLTLNFAPPPGTNLMVVNNTGSAPVQGVFDNLAQGQRVELTYNAITYAFVANYTGGTGNDLVLQWANTRLFAWGNNGYGGQLGNNSSIDSLVAVPVIASGVLAGKTVVAVASGAYHNLALCADGSLAAWGHNNYGQLGNSTSNSQAVPVAVMQTGVLAGKRVSAIAAGGSRSVALCDDGTIADWGQGYYGQLGNGDTSQQTAPVLVNRSGVLAGKTAMAVAAGGSHNLALCSDGTLVAWGSNSSGQLGDGTATDSSVPLLVNRTGVLAGKTVTTIATGGSHSLALCSDGTLAAWGSNSYGQLGDGSSANQSLPVAVVRTGVLSGKTITCIACGDAFSLVLCSDGTLAAWGSNWNGQLGTGTILSSSLPVLVTRSGVLSGKTVVAVSAANAQGLALCSDGNLAAWGYNSNGQLGNATATDSSLPVWVSKSPLATGENFTAASGGTYHSLALVASPPPPRVTTLAATGVMDTGATLQGSVNAQGGSVPVSFQFGLTSAYGTTLAATPANVTGSTPAPVAASVSGLLSGTTYHYRVVATSAGRTVTGADQTFTTTTLATLTSLGSSSGTLNPAFASVTTSYFATVPFATTSLTLAPACDNPAAIIQVNGATVTSGAASGPIALAVGNNPVNTVVSTGSNIKTYALTMIRLPQAFSFKSATDVPVTAADFAASGAAPGIALTFAPAPGTNLTVVNNTGRNPIQGSFANLAQGQVVNFTINGVTYPFVVNYFGGTGNDLVLQWANTRLLAWGTVYDDYTSVIAGQINSLVPVPVEMSGTLSGKPILSVATGRSHNLALFSDGSVASWGYNSYGQLGTTGGGNAPQMVDPPGALTGKTVVRLAAGYDHSLALCADGTLAAWGSNRYGQLGNNGKASGIVPTPVDLTGVLAGKTITMIVASVQSSMALCADGTIASWGYNAYCQLGDNSSVDRNAPVLVDRSGVLAGKTVTAIACGGSHGVALCSDGTVASWGRNEFGQLGNNTNTASAVPVLATQTGVLAGKTITAITAGYGYTTCLCADGTLVAWGNNDSGRLGNNSTTNSSVPVLVTQTGVLAGKRVTAVAAGAIGSRTVACCADGTVAAWGTGSLGNNTSANSSVPVLVDLTGLRTGERTVAVDSEGHALLLVASPPPPVVTTLAATAISDTSATFNGSVNAQGAATATSFEYGLTSSYGSSIVASPASVGGSTATAVSGMLSGLPPGTTYHYRVVTMNALGTVRGADLSFATTTLATLADLSLSDGGLSPAFASTITAYSITVPATTTSLTLTPVVTTPGATVKIAGSPVASGAASAALALTSGNNPFDVVVTSADGTTAMTYTVTVTRLPELFAFSAVSDVPLTVGNLVVTGSPAAFALNFAPAPGTRLTVVNNTGRNPIQGSFSNLAQGQAVNLTYGGVAYRFSANYFGGSGNDLVLEWATTRLMGWGDNSNGLLGDGTTTASTTPIPVNQSGVLAGKTLVAMACRSTHGMALCSDGTLAAWGTNTDGRLGNGTTTSSNLPTSVDRSGVLVGKTVILIAAGASHSLALCDDGTVAAWGSNNCGQLGNGTTTDSNVPVLTDLSGVLAGKRVVSVAADNRFSFALCADGTLAAWGYNGNGQLGNGSSVNTSVPVRVDQAGVLAGRMIIQIALGSSHCLALCDDGTLAAWGNNYYGALGDGSTSSSARPVLVSRTGVLAGKTVTRIASGSYHCLALCSDGTPVAWGYNSTGELGDDSTTNRSAPAAVVQTGALAGKTVVAISGGDSHSFFLCADGTLAACGNNSSARLGDGTSLDRKAPVVASAVTLGTGERILTVVAAVSTSHLVIASPLPPMATTLAASAILDTGATVQGRVNAQGPITTVAFEYGLTTAYGGTLAATPATASGTDATAASAALGALQPGLTYHFRLVATGPGGVVRGADRTFTTTTFAALSGLTASSGALSPAFGPALVNYTLTVPATVTSIALTPVVASLGARVSVGGVPVGSGTASAALGLSVGANRIELSVRAADGGNAMSYVVTVLRLPASLAFAAASDVPLTLDTLVTGGQSVAFALNYAPAAGTVLTVVNNTGRQPIRGTFANLAQWQAVNLTYNGVIYPFVANYFGGTGNDLVLQWANTRLMAWGYNANGELGNGSTTSSAIPVPVTMTGVLAGQTPVGLVCGSTLCADGTVAAWGYNGSGTVGDGTNLVRTAPVWVDRSGVLAGKTVVAIASGGSHELALCADGTLATWGSNGEGQLGNGGSTDSNVPVRVDSTGALAGKTVTAIAAGTGDNLALCSDGTLVAWGYNASGQLGDGSTVNRSVPVAVNQSGVLAGKQVSQIACDSTHCMVLCADGSVVEWGSNSYGELGNNGSINSSVPVLANLTGVLAGRKVAALACGSNCSLVLCADGTLAAWGYNGSGQLGNGGSADSKVPVLVTQTGVLAGKTVVAINAGTRNSCWARCSDGTLAGWGFNNYNELGNNSTTSSNVPVLVDTSGLASGERFMASTCGSNTGYAIVARPPAPRAWPVAATEVMDAGANLHGNVSAQGLNANVAFEYGLTTSYGVTVAAAPASVSGGTVTAVSAAASGLLAGTTYHYRVIATGGGGKAVSDDLTFTTSALATLSGLTLNHGALTPAFTSAITGYLAAVPSDVDVIRVTPVVAGPAATVKINGVSVASGAASGPLPLQPGENTLLIGVDAGDGVTMATYTVKVLRMPAVFTFNASDDVPLTVSDLAAGGQSIVIALNYAPVPGAHLMLVNNTGPNPIRGSFAGITEGQRVRLAYGGMTYSFVASYCGGTGNDLVLSWSSIRLVTWGSATNGGGSVTSNVPVAVNTDGVLAAKLIADFATGGSHGVLRYQDGTPATWGDNGYGQLGTGSTGSSNVPVAVDQTGVLAGKTLTRVATGGAHDLALCSDGTLVAWGYNSSGTLGNGGASNSSNVPVRVDQSGVLAGKTPVAIGAGGNHSVVLCADGSLAAWGYGACLGNGGTTSSNVPVRVDQTGVLAGKTPVALAVGGSHSLVLCADGTLAAWGAATSGQLGNGSITGGSVPVLVNRSGVLAGKTVIAIAAGGSHNLALCADGTLAAWGENASGQLGNFGSTDSTVPTLVNTSGALNGRKVIAIAAGGVHSLALCADGTLVAWGDNQYLTLGTGNSVNSSVPTPVASGTLRAGERIVAIAAGYYFSAALVAALPEALVSPLAATEITDSGATLNGSVNPQAGDVSMVFEYGQTSAYGNTVTATPAVASGNSASPISATIGSLLAGITYHYRVVAANGVTTVRSEDMTLTTTAYGVLADLRITGATLVPAFDANIGDYPGMAPFAVESIRVTPLAAMGTPTITVNGVALASGAMSDPIPLAVGENTIRVSVLAADGIQGKTYTLTLTRLPGEFAFNSLTEIPLTVGALGVAGSAPPFSLHQVPQPGTDLTVINNIGPRPITGTFDNLAQGQLVPLTYGNTTWYFVADYAGGNGNDLVLHWAGNRVFACGSNSVGQLGNGTLSDSAVPVPVDASGVLADDTIVGLAVGASGTTNGHSLALCANGKVAAWGYNNYGQLGNGSTTASKVPVWVDTLGVLAGKSVVAVSAGSGHNLALCSDGTIAAWGYNSYAGQLGNGSGIDSNLPVAVSTTGALAGKKVAAVAAGAYHNLALCSDGTLISWGSGAALGNGSTASYASAPVPVDQSRVLAGKRVVAIAAGQQFSLVLCDDGTLAAWGSNSTGVLGNGSTTDALLPVLVDRSGVLAGKTVVAIACGSLHALALCSDGTLAAWGANDRGQLGNNSTTASSVPLLVDQTGLLAGRIVASLSASSSGSMALCSNATLAAWGANSYGQLGDGSIIDRSLPTALDPRPLRNGGRFVMGGGGPSTAGHSLALVASPLPSAIPQPASAITGLGATLNGSVNAIGNATTVTFEYGLSAAYDH
ncbi:MAG: cadherin-like beta sandwich domain-containing protein, partial [Verrucomicrobiota bacterium]